MVHFAFLITERSTSLKQNKNMLFFLNLEFFTPIEYSDDFTRGNEVIEVIIQEMGGCRSPNRFTIPLLNPGQSFSRLKVKLLYQTDRCSQTLKDLYVQIRILRGFQRQLIYTSDIVLAAPYFIDGQARHIPIQRIFHYNDYPFMCPNNCQGFPI